MAATIPINATAVMSSTAENPRMFITPIPTEMFADITAEGGTVSSGRDKRNLVGKYPRYDKMALYFRGGKCASR